MNRIEFKEMDLSPEMIRGIKDMGFEEATPIQTLAIPKILEHKDITGQAQTGTGKTAAFGIPILETVDPNDKNLQSLILCPTRELAIQVAEELKTLSKYLPKVNILPVYGGQPIERQLKALKKGVHVIIGTPGRVMDHIDRGTLDMSTVKIMVLDEADEMLDMGFREDIEYVINDVPEERQFLLFSATLPKEILELTKKYQNNPEVVKVTHQELTTPEIDQKYFEVKEKMKIELLSRLLDIHHFNLSLVFCNTKRRVDKLVSHLQVRGYLADGLHGDLTQKQRDRVMKKFRDGNIDILVATDVAARGIDVGGVEAVFNYDVPNDNEYYVHRIGRTGRAGKTGKSYTFVAGREIYQLRDIQRYAKTKIEQMPIPSVTDVKKIKEENYIEKIKTIVDNKDLTKEIKIIEKLVKEDYGSIDVAAALLNDVMDEGKEAREEFGETGAKEGYVRFFINVGRKQGIKAKDIIGAVSEKTGLSSSNIGRIDILENFSFIEVPEKSSTDFYNFINGGRINNKHVNVEPARPRQKREETSNSSRKKGKKGNNKGYDKKYNDRKNYKPKRGQKNDRKSKSFNPHR
ncbi:MAG: DEAD/DEAH box helicase [Methanobacteriaceae archaeon]|nr:DEAD/DEAH box helicase [Methanobacteriaceae archaeon]